MEDAVQPSARPLASDPGREAPTAPHLVRMPGTDWAVWRCAGLRSPGFPVAHLLRLARPACALTADRLPDPADAAAPSRQSDWEAYRQAFAAALTSASIELRALASEDRFREALIWQNRAAWRSGIEAFVNTPAGTPRRRRVRQKEETVARYLQRYGAKNESIGFFGPFGWARWVDDGPPLSARPGPTLLARRTVFFEGWGIDALAETLARDRALLPWLSPRAMPFLSLTATTVHRPYAAPLRLTAEEAATLAACDGERTAREVAQDVRRAGFAVDDEQVVRIIERLCRRGLATWSLQVPLQIAPDAALRARLDRIGDPSVRSRALSRLDELEAARAAVARAAGDSDRLDHAMGDLEATFSRLTERGPTREPGQTYAGRTLVYEDCQRAVDVELGPQLLTDLSRPLSLLLLSARWFTAELAARYRAAFSQAYRELTVAGSSTVELAQRPLLALLDRDAGPLAATQRAFQERWSRILGLPTPQHRLAYRAQDLEPAVGAEFPARRPGWRLARYQSPDVMIAAESVDAIRRGEYQLVLGELHMSVNSLQAACTIAQLPRPADFFAGLDADLPEPLLITAIAKHWPRMTTRTHPQFSADKDFYLSIGPNAGGFSPAQNVPIASLLVEDRGDGVILRSRDGARAFDVIEAFALLLSEMTLNRFTLAAAAPHVPRIAIDRLVVCRESWSFAPRELGFASVGDEAERFAGARRWARTHDMPRFVFVRTPGEVKPFYVDFCSPFFVNTLAKIVRAAAAGGAPDGPVTVTEMLPAPDQAWLTDGDGRRYLSELRVVAVDPAGGG